MKLQGIIPAVVTPNSPLETKRYIEWLVQTGVEGIFALGTIGEGLLLTREDWAEAAKTIVEAAKGGRIPVIIQCGGIVQSDTHWKIETALQAGADAIAIMPPYFYSYSDEDLYTYYSDILSSWRDVPVFLYNIPKYARNQISPMLYKKLSNRFSNVLGIKDSSGSVDSLRAFVEVDKGLCVYSGSDSTCMEAFAVGVHGVVSGVAAALPEVAVRAWNELYRGENTEATRLVEISRTFQKLSTIMSVRMILEHRGFSVGGTFMPRSIPNKDEKNQLFQALREIGVTIN